MKATTRPASANNPLLRRLAALRRRLRMVVAVRGVSWLVAIVLATALLAGLLDWYRHLPALVRACFLVGGLSAAGVVGYLALFRPLRAPADDLSLALRIEERFPSLNDSLASTVQFLEQAGKSRAPDSPAMRLEAVRRAMNKSEGIDFNRVVDSRGLRTASL